MAIEELTAIIPPPVPPSHVPDAPDWNYVETGLGISLPSDYKDFVVAYGTGLLSNFVRVYNPFDPGEYSSLLSCVRMDCAIFRELKENEGDEEVPFAVYPDQPGILPWGNDENGNFLFWHTEGQPHRWPCIVGAGRDRRWHRIDLPMTAFLARAIKGDIKCEIWPEDFAIDQHRRYTFEPFESI